MKAEVAARIERIWISVNAAEGQARMPVQAQQVVAEGFEEFDLYVHPTPNSMTGWTIAEKTTGLALFRLDPAIALAKVTAARPVEVVHRFLRWCETNKVDADMLAARMKDHPKVDDLPEWVGVIVAPVAKKP